MLGLLRRLDLNIAVRASTQITKNNQTHPETVIVPVNPRIQRIKNTVNASQSMFTP